jgi:hypothetical protein
MGPADGPPAPGRTGGEVEVRLDSLVGLEDTRLAAAGLDSSIGSRWQFSLGPTGPKGAILGGRPTILAGQVEAIARLLFPPLPSRGVGITDVWADSTAYRVHLDAFDGLRVGVTKQHGDLGYERPDDRRDSRGERAPDAHRNCGAGRATHDAPRGGVASTALRVCPGGLGELNDRARFARSRGHGRSGGRGGSGSLALDAHRPVA